MYDLVGDMYREDVVVYTPPPSYPSSTEPPDPDLHAVWVNYPASWSATDHRLVRMEDDRTMRIQGISVDRLSAPEDIEPNPENIDFLFKNVPVAMRTTLKTLFSDNYGHMFSIRSHPHCKIFIGYIPTWNELDGGDCDTDFGFNLVVRESIFL